jgi:hypothetical protein
LVNKANIEINHLTNNLQVARDENAQLKSQIQELTSAPVYDLTNQEVGRVQRDTSDVVESNNRKRKRPAKQSLEHQCEVVRVKLEKKTKQANEVKEHLEDQLEDAQDLNGCLIRSENNKMTEIDALKEQMRTMQRRIDALEN